jgi:hypothetical protein
MTCIWYAWEIYFPTDGYYLCEQAFLVIVRNKKRVGYTYELTLKIEVNLVSLKLPAFPLSSIYPILKELVCQWD